MVHTDYDETRDVQEKRIVYFKRKEHFTEDGMGAEITIDLVLQARENMFENKVNGQMIKKFPCRRSAPLRSVFRNPSWA